MSDSREGRIAIALQFETAFGRSVTRGIIAYSREHTHWRLWRQRDLDPDQILFAQASGLICQNILPAQFQFLRQHHIPIVVVGKALPDLSCVFADENAVATMAAEHLIQLGLRNFAFVGSGNWPFVHARLSGFQNALISRGFEPPRLFIESLYEGHNRRRFESMLEEWVSLLPRPCGVLAAHDPVGVEVIAAARRAKLRIPDDLAVVGVDDDELACELSDVPLSSVAQPTFAIGYEVARLLHRVIDNPSAEPVTFQLPPIRVVPRASSDMIALEDDDVARALRLIRDHATDPINVEWLVKRIPVARRSLERRFRQATGRSLLEQIHLVRFQKARELLAGTDLGLKDVARRAGFRNARWLARSFKHHLNTTPGEFRRRYRPQR